LVCFIRWWRATPGNPSHPGFNGQQKFGWGRFLPVISEFDQIFTEFPPDFYSVLKIRISLIPVNFTPFSYPKGQSLCSEAKGSTYCFLST
jgi:hypothetical protein